MHLSAFLKVCYLRVCAFGHKTVSWGKLHHAFTQDVKVEGCEWWREWRRHPHVLQAHSLRNRQPEASMPLWSNMCAGFINIYPSVMECEQKKIYDAMRVLWSEWKYLTNLIVFSISSYNKQKRSGLETIHWWWHRLIKLSCFPTFYLSLLGIPNLKDNTFLGCNTKLNHRTSMMIRMIILQGALINDFPWPTYLPKEAEISHVYR